MRRRAAGCAALLGAAAASFTAGGASAEGALPLAEKTVTASADECAVWRRERSFAASVEAHDGRAFAEHLHPGTVFNAGAAEADRGRAAVEASWAAIVEGKALVLRWRPGIVQIGGEPRVAVSKGPYILQTTRDGQPLTRVGFYQTIWTKDDAGTWRVLFDGPASTPQPVADRAAAEAWVVAQPMSACS